MFSVVHYESCFNQSNIWSFKQADTYKTSLKCIDRASYIKFVAVIAVSDGADPRLEKQ
jgi:hypothetical protein